MSLRRIGARTALVAAGALVSVAMMTAPSWAAKGNSANAAFCEPGGYPGVLFNQQGEPATFKNEGACTKAGAKGELVGLEAVAGLPSNGTFGVSYSGFGLKPGTGPAVGAKYSGFTEIFIGEHVASNGTFSTKLTLPCVGQLLGQSEGPVTSLFVTATTASGQEFGHEFLAPSNCT